jgi:hypothetical protein
MSTPKELCLEELDLTQDDERYIRCVALPGGEPGLALDREGAVRWMPDGPAAYGIWVSADDRLVLLRGEGAGPIVVERAGRSLEAPAERPVILLDQDLLRINGRRLRVHVHGEADIVHEPERLTRSALTRMARAAATAMALGAALGAGSASQANPLETEIERSTAPIEVRRRPPAPMPRRRPVECTITAMKSSKKGPVMVHAICPKGTKLYKGLQGHILDPKSGAPLKNGNVFIESVKSSKTAEKVVGSAPNLKQPVKAKSVRFLVRW